MRSYKMAGFGQPLGEVLEDMPEPRGSEVLLRVGSCGVCHSDVHVWEGWFDLGGGRKLDFAPNVVLPHTLGHEIAGEVVAVGPGVKHARLGQRYVVYPWIGCGQCARCAAGDDHLCAAPRTLGIRVAGGFADQVRVPDEKYLVDFGALREEFACTCACSGLTSYSALKKLGRLGAGDPLVIIGAGGVGLAAIRLAHAVTGVAPVVAEIDRAKWAAAEAAGASRVFDPRDAESASGFMAATGGAMAVVDFVGAQSSVEFGMSLLRKGGTLVLVGLFGGSTELSLPLLSLRAISLVGSFVGSLAELREVVALANAGVLGEIPIETRPLAQAQRTLDDLKGGRVVGRVVLKP